MHNCTPNNPFGPLFWVHSCVKRKAYAFSSGVVATVGAAAGADADAGEVVAGVGAEGVAVVATGDAV